MCSAPSQRLIEEEAIERRLVYNADETGLYWRQPGRVTLALAEEGQLSGEKLRKERITVMVAASAAGQKVPLFFIGQSQKPRALKQAGMLGRYHWHGNSNAWMTLELFDKWMQEVFLPTVAAHHPQDKKVLLVVDNCSAHPDRKSYRTGVGNQLEVVVRFLPPNMTSQMQPMDQGT